MAKTEIAVVGGAETEVPVLRRIRITADCSCWNHRAVEFDIIVTPRSRDHEHGQVLIKSAIAEHHFRLSDRNGPIDIRIEDVKQE